MNNIYKVIWSKAKNCYVVASEIARSHTKSASGSEKIGGGTRRALLASLMAVSLLYGGLGVASATLEVVNQNGAAGTTTIYTKEEVDNALKEKGLATDVATNKANIAKLQEDVGNATSGLTQKVTEQGEKIATNTADIGTNKDNIKSLQDKKLDITTASATYATRDALNTLQTAVNDKVDESTLTTALDDKANTDLSNLTAAGETKIKETMSEDMEKKANKDTVTALVGRVGGLETTVGGASGGLVKGVADLNAKTTKISYDAATDTTSVNGMKVGQQVDMGGKNITNVGAINGIALGTKEGGTYISQDGSIWGNMKKVDTQVKTNADAIAQEKTDREKAIGNLTEDKNYIKKDKNVSDNLVELDKQAKTNADAIAETNQRTAGITRDDTRKETSIESKVTVDTNGNIKAEGTITSNGLNAGDGDIKTNGKVSAGDVSTGTLETTGNAKIGGNLDVTGTLNIKDVTAETINISKSEENTHYKSEGSIIGEGGNLSVSNKKFDKRNNITKESQLNVNEEGTVNWATSTDATGNKTEGRSEVTADNIKNSVKKTEGGKTFGYEENITAGGKGGTVTDKAGNTTYTKVTATENSFQVQDKDEKNKNHQVNTKDSSVTEIKNEAGATTKTEQTATDITNTAKNGTITNDANHIENKANTMDTTVTGKATESYGGLETTVNGNETHHVTGNQTNTIDRDQVNTIGGSQTTNVTGDISNTAENIINEANTKLTDKVGDHTRVLDRDGITDTVGGSTFKQRIDKIMMESKDVSIKAEETLTNEAKVITNKASEVINNEAVNINNTATGIITSKASEIKNQADKLISNKVGENTSEYMEDGKITTSVKDGAKSTVTIQNADGLQTGVTNGTSTNASATTATSSAQTIASGNKANSVITTIDGTQFVNTDAAAPVTGESGAGTADRTTIKGNTITTGKVTMDYADVMKDLGVRGNANINGKTTTGSLEVTGTSTLKGDVTMESNATVKKNLNVEGITTTKTLKVTENAEIDGTLKVSKKATFEDSVAIAKDLSVGGDVTAKSYKVGDKTYISADGINANDQKITNVADGSISEGSKDAVNGGQLYGMKTDLEHKVDKVGANAAAMANLHPMEFDPDSKWNIAAAMGSYGSETATAIGAFYRPNEDVMVNFSTAFGTGENMVGGGVSVRLGKGSNKLSREESNALKDQVNDLTARMDALLSVLNPNMSKDFPDVPENHWAYEAVSRLAGNDIVQGYPDGEFHGDRTMTRYEMAEIIYNALSRGAEAERELVEEFKPELQAMAASEKATAERAEG